MGLESLSDSELLALRKKPAEGGLGHLSNEDLLKMRAAPASAPAANDPYASADVSPVDRAIIKNLSANPEAGLQFLKEHYPQAKIDRQGDQLFIDGKPLDPNNFSLEGMASYLTHPGELLQDVGDLAYDIPAGMAQGTAATAAAVAAAPATAGAGSIPAAMGASGAMGAGLEALRNYLGQKAGLKQEQSASDITTSGTVGLATPLLFGTGAGAKDVAKELLDSQKGLLGKGYNQVANKIAPKAAEFLSGTPAEAINTLKNNPKEMEALGSGAELDLAKQAHSRLVEGFKNIKSSIGGKLQNAIESSGQKVDISGVKSAFQKQIDDYTAKLPKMADGSLSKESQGIVDELKSSYDNIFKGTPKTVDTLEMGKDGILNKVQKEVSSELPDKLSASEAFKLQDQLKDVADMFSTKPAMAAKSVSTADATGKQIGQTAYHALNEELDKATGGMSSQLKGEYADYKKVEKYLSNYFKTPEQTFNTLTNLDRKARIPLLRNLEDVSNKYGIDVSKDAKLLQAHNVFGDPSLQGIAKGTSNTTVNNRLRNVGRAAGGGLGTIMFGPGWGTVGGAAGGGIAAEALANPAMIKKYVGAQLGAEKAAQTIAPYLPNPNKVVPTVWDLLNGRE